MNLIQFIYPCFKLLFEISLVQSPFDVLNKYIYGFTYIECFFPMNIYRSLYEGIIGKDENKDFSNHRVFDPFFSYLGIIVLAFFFVKDKEQNEIVKEKEKDDNGRAYSSFEIKLIYNKKKEYLKNIRGLIQYILIVILFKI